jgi:hypothetical protein
MTLLSPPLLFLQNKSPLKRSTTPHPHIGIMTDADVDMTELQAAAEAAASSGNPESTERPPSRREDLLSNAFFDVERGECVSSIGGLVGRGLLSGEGWGLIDRSMGRLLGLVGGIYN